MELAVLDLVYLGVTLVVFAGFAAFGRVLARL
jgi:hypothetical protein